MLEAIRERAQGWIARVILGLIIVSFAIWGLGNYFSGGKETPAATVGDAEISQREFLEALKQQREALRLPADLPAETDKALRQEVLEQLINSEVLKQAAERAGFIVPPARIEEMLQQVPAFQENGQFSQARLDAWLRNRGMSRKELLELVRQDMLLRQLQFAYAEGSVLASASAEQLARLLAQARTVNELFFDRKAFLPQIQVEEAAIKAEYEAHKADYAVPEQARLQYVVLSIDALREQVGVDEAAARQFYEANKQRYQEPEMRQASHILVRATAEMSAEARAAAKAKAEKLLQTVQQNPAGFAAIARRESEDPVSAARGGDLGTFSREMMVKPFADAVFAMRPGEIRGLVESEFGYHIIRLEAIHAARQIPFESVRAEVVAQLRAQEAQRRFAEVAEQFSNMVYEQPDGLEPVAKAFKLPLQETGWVSRGRAEPAFLNHNRLMEAIFAKESIEQRHNTEAIEVGPNRLIAARVLEYRPASTRPLEEVAEAIRFKLAFQRAGKKAVEAGEQALQAAKNGQTPTNLSAPMVVSRLRAMNLPPAAVKAIFKADTKSLPAWVGVETEDGYRLYRINQVSQGELPPEQVQGIRQDLQRMQAQEELRAFLTSLKAQSKIKSHPEVLAQKAE